MSNTDETIRELLLPIANKLSYEKCDIKLTPISTNGANFSSKPYEVSISVAGKPDIELFAKVGVISEETRELIKVDPYSREFVFYNEVMSVYKQLEDKHHIPEEHRLCIANYYGCNEEYLKETIVLENLLKKGFVCYDRLKCVDWPYASACVKQIAIYHASSIAYAQEYPQKFADTAKKLQFVFPKRLFEQVVDTVLKVAKEEYRKRLSRFLSENLRDDNYEKFYKPNTIEVIVHSDFRPSNLMHRVLKNGELQVALLDFQTIHTANPVIDLLFYISNATDEEFRRQHYHSLINYYYEELRTAMRRFKLDPDKIYPKQNFDLDLKQVLPYGLLVATHTLLYVTVDDENIPTVDGNLERDGLGIKTSALYAERMNGIIADYIKMGVL